MYSTNFQDDTSQVYPGNSFAIGGDETLREHITLANIFREFNPSIVGASHGDNYDNNSFNVAISGRTSSDMPRQAQDLIDRMKNKGIRMAEDWKLITIFIGTNDFGKLLCVESCTSTFLLSFATYCDNSICFSSLFKQETTSREEYKSKIEEAISLLRSNTKRTIVSIVSIWNSQLIYDAASLIA
ncbi:hypothetical protein COOONC_15833, partial [Cooperia oncophora]